MNTRLLVVILLLLVVTSIGGYAVGSLLQSRETPSLDTRAAEVVARFAPLLMHPADGSEFVDSELQLAWTAPTDLGPDQFYAIRIWTDEHPYREIWTVDQRISIADTIDSYSYAVGSFYWQVAIVNVDADGVFSNMGSEWSEIFQLRRVRRLSIPAKSFAEMSPVAQDFSQRDLSASELIDAVHRFIQTNSIPDLQERYAADYSDAIQIMYDYAQGRMAEPPHLLCDGRSTAMLTILGELGIESRLVFLYSPAPGYLAQHTTLEVFNPESQRWQVHDLAWDIYYVESPSLERVSAERILFGSHSDLLGCPIQGGPCDADAMQDSIGYFDALRYGYTFEVWVNPDRFDLSMRFAGQQGKNLAEFIGGDHLRKVTIRMDNWGTPESAS